MMDHKVSLVKCGDYEFERLKHSIDKSLSLLGGIKRYIRKGSKVLIKPNLLSARKPEENVTTHPLFVKAVIAIAREAGGIVFLGDSPSGLVNDSKLKKIHGVTGMEEVCRQTQTRIISFEEDLISYENKSGRVYRNFTMSGKLRDFDVIISLPKMKTHNFTLLTGAIKNNYGFIPGLRKAELHIIMKSSELFSEMLLDVVQTIKPSLIITDAVVSMEGAGGPDSGNSCNTGLIISGTNAGAVDFIMARIMGYNDPLKVPTNKAAVKRGVLTPEKIEVLGERLEDVIVKDFKRISSISFDRIPGFLKDWAKHILSPKPVIVYSTCTKCGSCVEICPVKTIIREEDNTPVIEYNKCIRCFCCKETCPSSAINIRRMWLLKLLKIGD